MWLGSVVTLLTKHLAPKMQAPPAGLGVRGDATLQTPAFTAQASGQKQPAATAASHDLGEILLDAVAEDSGENLLDAAVEDPKENLPDAAAEDSEEDLPDAAVQVPQENPSPAVAQAHHLQPSYEYDSDIEFNVVDGQVMVRNLLRGQQDQHWQVFSSAILSLLEYGYSTQGRGELHKALKDAQYWRRQCKLEQEHSVSLRANIRFLENKVEKQLGNLQKLVQELPSMYSKHIGAHQPEPGAVVAALGVQLLAAPIEAPEAEAPEAEPPAAPDAQPPMDELPNFSPTADGRFHLCNNTFIDAENAAKIFKNKKGTIAVREAAQAIWGTETLAQRRVCGRLLPGDLNAKQLTPAKVQVVSACLEHWGYVNKKDTTIAAANLTRTLSDKIQDVKRKLRLQKEGHHQ
ncbi:uncharacterized protein ISCGN_006893 [Ixodes scapularis]